MDYATLRGVHEIPVDEIVPDPNQPRKARDKEYIVSLGNSIKNEGQQTPIQVHWDEALGKFKIEFGEMRWTGSWMVGLKTIMANVVEKRPETEIFVSQIVENVSRENMSPMDTAKAWKRAVDNGTDLAELAARTGKSASRIQSDINLLNLLPKQQQEVEDGNFPVTVARYIAAPGRFKNLKTAWDKAKEGKGVSGMMQKLQNYEQVIQTDIANMFDRAEKTAEKEVKRDAGKEWDKFEKALKAFSKTSCANGGAALMVTARSRKIHQIEFALEDAEKIVKHLLSTVRQYREVKGIEYAAAA